jgi:membrane protease YdiL (CAAX protease family)
MSRRASARATLSEPYLLFLVLVGIGLGTISVRQPVRLALLWVALVALSVIYRSHHEVDVGFSLPSLGRGALLGLVISVPLLAFLAGQLRAFNERLYDTADIVLLLYQVCFISAPLEEYFFRGIMQSQKGSSVAIGLYAVLALLYFLPHAPLLATFIVFVAMGILGIVYGYVREHYGLAASVGCHVVVGFVLQVAPSLISSLRSMLS